MTNAVELAFKNSKAPVLVAHPTDDLSGFYLKHYADKKTGINVYLNYSKAPYSPITGKDLTPYKDKLLTVSSTELKELTPICVCSNCSSTLRTSSNLAKKLSGHTVHCIFCGTGLIATKSLSNDDNNSGEDDNDNDDSSDDDNDDSGEDDSDNEDDDSGEDDNDNDDSSDDDNDDSGEDDSSDDNDNEDSDNDDSDNEDSDNEDDEDPGDTADLDNSKRGREDTSAEIDNEVEGDVPSIAPPDTGDDDAAVDEDTGEDVALLPDDELNNDDLANKSEARVKIKFNLLNSNKAAISAAASHLVLSNDQYYLIVNNQPIARLIKDKASENIKPLFNKPQSLGSAFFTVANGGLNETVLNDFGVQPVVLEVPVDEVTEQRIRKTIEGKENKLKMQQNSFRENFQQAMSIAAIGINKGLFNECENILKANLYEEMSRIGIKHPEKIIDRVFAKAGGKYNKSILDKAMELIKETPATRNAIAKLVETSSYSTAVQPSEGDELNNKISENSVIVTTTAAAAPSKDDGSSGYKHLFVGMATHKRAG